MVVEMNAAIQSLKALTELVKAGYSVRNANEIATAVAEVNAKLMPFLSLAVEAKEKEATLLDRIRELEKEVRQLKDWNREEERYQLANIASGVPAYVLKPGMEQDEPPHHLCANCFAKKEKSFLQYGPPNIGVTMYRCIRCGSTFFPAEGR